MKKGITVLTIGESAHMQQLSSILRHISAIEEIEIVSKGTQAVNLYRDIKPDIVFCDALLPDMSGFEAARFIKEQEPQMRIIICSANYSREFLLTVLTLHFNGYLPGHIDESTLTETVRAVLANKTYVHYGIGSPAMRELLIHQYHTLVGTGN